MRSVGAHGELELEEQLVGCKTVTVASAAELSANLAELARPVGKDQRPSSILDERGNREVAHRRGERIRRLARAALRAVETAAQEPPAGELVIAGNIVAEGRERLSRV